jgi:hypothetical protein
MWIFCYGVNLASVNNIHFCHTDGTIKTYFAEVESVREGGKVVQRYIRSLGTDPENPTNIAIEPTHFSYLSLRLMQGSLTPNDLFEMLENMGQPVKKADLGEYTRKHSPGSHLLEIFFYKIYTVKNQS